MSARVTRQLVSILGEGAGDCRVTRQLVSVLCSADIKERIETDTISFTDTAASSLRQIAVTDDLVFTDQARLLNPKLLCEDVLTFDQTISALFSAHYIDDTLTFVDEAIGHIAVLYESDADNTLIWSDTAVSQYLPETHEAQDSITFIQSADHSQIGRVVDDTFVITDEASQTNTVKTANLVDVILFFDDTIVGGRQSLAVEDQMTDDYIEWDQDTGLPETIHYGLGQRLYYDLIRNDGIDDYLLLNQEASPGYLSASAIPKSSTDTIVFSDEADRLPENAESFITFEQSVDVDHTTPIVDSIEFTDSASVALTLVPEVVDTLDFYQATTFAHFSGGIFCSYSPAVGESTDPDAPRAPNVEPPSLDPQDNFKFFYPYYAPPDVTLIVRVPDFGNQDEFSFQRINRQTRGGELVVFSDPVWPKVRKMKLAFSSLKEDEAQEILDFIALSLGKVIGLQDWLGRFWAGVITTPDAAIIRNTRGGNDIALEIEIQPLFENLVGTDTINFSDEAVRGGFDQEIFDNLVITDEAVSTSFVEFVEEQTIFWADTLERNIVSAKVLPDDSIVFTDEAVSQQIRSDSLTDILVFSDEATSLRIVPRDITDAIVFSDEATSARFHDENILDTLAFTDTASEVAVTEHFEIDGIFFTDEAIGNHIIQPTIDDTLTLSDEASREAIADRTVEDTIDFVVTVGLTRTLLFSETDTLTFTDQAVGSTEKTFSETDTVIWTDTATRQYISSPLIDDTLTFADEVLVGQILSKASEDTITFTDEAVGVTVREFSETDTLVFTDEATRVAELQLASEDTLVLSDLAESSHVRSSDETDTIIFVDEANPSILVADRTASDTLVFNHQAIAYRTRPSEKTDVLTFTDEAIQQTTISLEAEDTIGFFFSLGVQHVNGRDILDTLIWADDAIAVTERSSISEDTLTLSDEAIGVTIHIESETDTILFTDDLAELKTLNKTIVDTLTLDDTADKQLIHSPTGLDTITFTDEALAEKSVALIATDTILFTDEAVSQIVYSRLAEDAILFTDEAVGERIRNRYWLGNTTSWNSTSNWSSTSGGTSGASVPDSETTVYFDGNGTGNCTLDVAAVAKELNMAAGYTGTIDMATFNMTVSGDVTLEGNVFDVGTGTLQIGGNFDAVSLTTYTRGASTLRLTGTDKIFSPHTNMRVSNLRVDGTITSSSGTFNSYGTLDIYGTFTMLSPKSIILNTQSFGSDLKIQSGGRLTGTGTIDLQFCRTSKGVSVMDGVFDIASANLWYWNNTAILVPGYYNSSVRLIQSATFVNTAVVELSAGVYQFKSLEFTGASTVGSTITLDCGTNAVTSVTVDDLFNINGTGTNYACTVDNSGNSVIWYMKGGVGQAGSSNTWTAGNGKVVIQPTVNANYNFAGLTLEAVENNPGAFVPTLTGALSCASFDWISGRLDFNSQTLTTTNDFTIQTTASPSGVDFNGCSIVVGGDFDANGTVSVSLNLTATAAWDLDVTGTASASYVSVAYSDASGGTNVEAPNSTDNGNNDNWIFGTITEESKTDSLAFTDSADDDQIRERYWIGATTAWNSTANWSLTSGGTGGASIPDTKTTCIFDNSTVTGVTLTVSPSVKRIECTNYTGIFSCNGQNVTVSDGFIWNSGSFVLGADTLAVTGDLDIEGANFTVSTGIVQMAGTGSITTTGGETFYNLIIAATSNITLNDTISVNGLLSISGTLTIISAKTVTLNDTLYNSDLKITSTGTITGAGNLRLYESTGGRGISQMDGVCSLGTIIIYYPTATGAFKPGHYDCEIILRSTSGNSNNSTLTLETGTYRFNALSFENLSTSNGDYTLDVGANAGVTLTVDNLFSMSATGTNGDNYVDMSGQSNTITMKGAFTQTATSTGTNNWTKGTGDVNIELASDETVDFTGFTMEDILIDGAFEMTVGGNFTCDSIDWTNGGVDFNGKTVTTVGAFTIGIGADPAGAGFNGCTIAVGGNFSATGESGALHDMVATIAWNLNVTGTAAADYVNVAYSAAGGTTISATNSTNSGNNSGWSFS